MTDQAGLPAPDNEACYRIAVLGDSRVFDTYYATEAYAGLTYGYHKTFPHVLQRMLARRSPEGAFDCVHIPDHFRGRTVENNILRLALIDPECVVLCDAIWESLLSRKNFAEHVEGLAASGGGAAIPEYSDALLVALYEKNLLSLSPVRYAARVARIASWFTRRRRRVIWLTTPVPPVGHLGGLHYAGNYRPIEGWHRCLSILNEYCVSAVRAAGGEVLDLDVLMASNGGAAACLIDQWHFSEAFHSRIAGALSAVINSRPHAATLACCVSHRVMVQGPVDGVPVHLVGTSEEREAFKRMHPKIAVTGESESAEVGAKPDHAAVVVLFADPGRRDAAVAHMMTGVRTQPVIVFPEELEAIDNPAAADRSSFGSFK